MEAEGRIDGAFGCPEDGANEPWKQRVVGPDGSAGAAEPARARALAV